VTKSEAERATVEGLVQAYRAATFAHRQAAARASVHYREVNRLHDVVALIYREVRARGLAAQTALLPLLQDPDIGVRCWAATHALEFAPERGEPVLEEVAASDTVLSLMAASTLDIWRSGKLDIR
jgi:hypothetical protein